jgi:hypothetical protein
VPGFAARSMVVVAASRLEQPLGRLRPSAFQPLVETRNAVVCADFNCNFPQAFGIRAKGSFMLYAINHRNHSARSLREKTLRSLR